MPDKPQSKKLETVLARLEKEWQELADLLKSQGLSQERVIEVEKILLRDAAGNYRGKISANKDSSTGLLLSDNQGKAWAWLGVDQHGEAFLELKDHKGETSFKVPVGAPSPEAGSETAAATPPLYNLEPPPQPPGSGGQIQPPTPPEPAIEAPPGRPGDIEPPPTASQEGKPGGDVDARLFERLENLEQQNRRQRLYRAFILGLFGLILAAQAFWFFRPQPPGPLEVESLVVRDPNGVIRAWLGDKNGKAGLDLWDRKGKRRATLSLGPEGSPGLALYDQDQQVRAELNLGPAGVPKFTLRDKLGLMGQTEPGGPQESAKSQVTAPEVVYVGSKTSNKYHYPTCKWAKKIRPERLIIFKSVKEAQDRHYIPCPVCKPPPLGK
jgi:hypothetical protein